MPFSDMYFIYLLINLPTMRNVNNVARQFEQYRNVLSKTDKYKQKSESILGLIERAWDRMPALMELGEWKAGDELLVNEQFIGKLNAFAIVNNNAYAWIEVNVNNIVEHFGIKLADIRRIENA